MQQIPPITILYGGWSGEREVSLKSGKDVAVALDRMGVKYRLIDVTRDILSWLSPLLTWPDTIVFNALHGVGGEDGTIQGILDTIGIKYTHSGRLASAIAMHKVQSKLVAQHCGVHTAPWWNINHNTTIDFWDSMKYPLVMKPVDEGSSIGVFIVHNAQQAKECLPKLPPSFMAEEYIAGMELTVGILNNLALPVIEIDAGAGFYDYTAKYDPNHHADFILPARIDDGLKNLLQQQSIEIYNAIGCKGVARIDWRYDPSATNNKPVFLEINTQPGMTSLSLVPAATKNMGMSFDELVLRIISAAIA